MAGEGRKHPGRRIIVCLLEAGLVGGWAVACDPGGGGRGGGVQRWDSAGVEIVESPRPAWEEGEGWAVGSVPMVRIGVVEGESAFQFTGITGAVRLRDGTVVVADEGSQEVRFFGPDGAHRRTVGRRGGGPGEFTGLAALGKDAGGRVWAYDFSLRRITWMDGEGNVTGLTSLGLEPAMLFPLGLLVDETFLLKQLWGAEVTSQASTTGLRRDPIAFVRFGRDGSLVDTLGLFPGREVYITEEDGRGVMNTPPFARNTSATIRGDRVVVGAQSRYELCELSPEGRLLRLIRIPGREKAVGAEELEGYIQSRLQTAPPERHPEIRRSLEGMPIPGRVPPYGALLTDSGGNLWVGEWAMYPETARSWDVFDATGAWLGTVLVPSDFDPRDLGDDWILGVARDALDVETVVLYPLIKVGVPGT